MLHFVFTHACMKNTTIQVCQNILKRTLILRHSLNLGEKACAAPCVRDQYSNNTVWPLGSCKLLIPSPARDLSVAKQSNV